MRVCAPLEGERACVRACPLLEEMSGSVKRSYGAGARQARAQTWTPHIVADEPETVNASSIEDNGATADQQKHRKPAPIKQNRI